MSSAWIVISFELTEPEFRRLHCISTSYYNIYKDSMGACNIKIIDFKSK